MNVNLDAAFLATSTEFIMPGMRSVSGESSFWLCRGVVNRSYNDWLMAGEEDLANRRFDVF